MSNTKMKGYKAFEKGMICRGKQYAENTVFEETEAQICHSGMHFCENPLDTLDYYPLLDDDNNLTEFAEVVAIDKIETDDNKKFCTKKLKIGAKLNLSAFIKASFNFLWDKSYFEPKSGDNSKLASSGYDSQLASSGDNSVIAGIGINNKAKGVKGCWIVLAEWKYNGKNYIPVCVKSEQVDGEKIKEDTFYMLENGEFKECV